MSYQFRDCQYTKRKNGPAFLKGCRKFLSLILLAMRTVVHKNTKSFLQDIDTRHHHNNDVQYLQLCCCYRPRSSVGYSLMPVETSFNRHKRITFFYDVLSFCKPSQRHFSYLLMVVYQLPCFSYLEPFQRQSDVFS